MCDAKCAAWTHNATHSQHSLTKTRLGMCRLLHTFPIWPGVHAFIQRAVAARYTTGEGGSGRAPLVANGPSLPPASNTSRQEGVPKFGVLVLLEATRNLRTCQCCAVPCRARNTCACQSTAYTCGTCARTANSNAVYFTSCCKPHARKSLSLARAASPSDGSAQDGRLWRLEIGVFR